ncbi:hypothetical protein VNI00_010663 [Paramarasmius palmivorus]|uniref:Cerato-platanin n=1 Tax=Paramarasmius palmivorus TaxID=297713 RepID=A0AAW0CGV5_9AGAR
MKFITAIALLATSAAALNVPRWDTDGTYQLRYDSTYGNPSQSLSVVSCSNGDNGMITKGYNTVGDVPTYVGAAQGVSWDSPNCGTCWQISYGDKSINMVAVDYAASGFRVSPAAMDYLTNNQAFNLGVVDVQVKQVDKSVCNVH